MPLGGWFGGGQQQQGGGPNWNLNVDMNRAFDQQNAANTPFHVQQIKDAFGSHNAAMNNLGGTIGSQLNANAQRQADARQQGVGWAQSQGVLPFEFSQFNQGVNQAYGGVKQGAPDPFQSWLQMNDQYQKARANTAMDIQHQQAMQAYNPDLLNAQQNQIDRGRQNAWNSVPLMQQQMGMYGGLLSSLFGGLNGGTGGGLPNSFSTNFGGSGGWSGATNGTPGFNMSQPNF